MHRTIRFPRQRLTIFLELALAASEFAQTIADLAACDVGQQLSASLSGLADVERKVQELQSAQAHDDLMTVLSTGQLTEVYHI